MTVIDSNSATWKAASRHVEELLADARRDLEAPLIDERRSDFLRGQISAYISVLNLAAQSKDPIIEMRSGS